MQKMIWIPDDVIEGIKESAVREGKTVSQYLVDCHKSRIKPDVKNAKFDFTAGLVDNSTLTATKVLENRKGTIAEEPGDAERLKKAKTKYSEEYRKKNPMERCFVCQKALSMNCGH